MTHHDLCIVGTGSGNTILDEQFDHLDVAIVERGAFGGTCLNRGCIPTKMLVHPADLVEHAVRSGHLGIDLSLDGIRWHDIRGRVFGRIDPIAEGGEQCRRSQQNVTVYTGTGRFTEPVRMSIVDGLDAGAEVTADRWVLAAGSRPMIPEIDGLDTIEVHTSDTIMRIDELPRRLVVLGGGFIGCELAHVFAAFGVEVTVIARSGRLLSHQDPDISEAFTIAVSHRMDVRLNTMAERIEAHGDGTFTLVAMGPSAPFTIDADMFLVATGRDPNSDQLDVAAAGVDVDDCGFVVTDELLQTSVPGMWALGDIRTPHMLKHVANHEARVIQHNLLHPDSPTSIREDHVPYAVFTDPQIASVGLTEDAARSAGHDVSVSRRNYGDTAFGWALDDDTSFCKLVADTSSRRLLGAHIIGPEAAILIQQLVQGMSMDLSIDQMAHDQMYIHPALSEVIEQALLDL